MGNGFQTMIHKNSIKEATQFISSDVAKNKLTNAADAHFSEQTQTYQL